MQLPGYLEFEISQHHIKQTLVETLTDMIGIVSHIMHEVKQVGGFIRPYLVHLIRLR